MMRWVCIAILVIVTVLLLLFPLAHAQHNHGNKVIPNDLARFYENWMKPDNRTQSCCNRLDCDEAPAKFENGRWRAFSRIRQQWVDIPPEKIEREREVPPGAHLCENLSGVLCFGVGGGS